MDEPIIAASALKHGLGEEEILHAYRNPIGVGPRRRFMMIVGANQAAIILEVGYIQGSTAIVIVHAAALHGKGRLNGPLGAPCGHSIRGTGGQLRRRGGLANVRGVRRLYCLGLGRDTAPVAGKVVLSHTLGEDPDTMVRGSGSARVAAVIAQALDP